MEVVVGLEKFIGVEEEAFVNWGSQTIVSS
jgi:hypothetical protein